MYKISIIALLAMASIWPLAESVAAQNTKTVEQTAIEKLAFLVGHWAGEGRSIAPDGTITVYHDVEKAWFDAQNSLLIIQANGFRENIQTYSLHTIIYYDKAEGHYRYHPYDATGYGEAYACQINKGVLQCLNQTRTYRLTFRIIENGKWNEFGENLQNGQWVKNFETVLSPVSEEPQDGVE